ncbi:MAG: ribosome recycling factor [Candidatus Aminicenantes bacterium]|nr:MAG: ribosome recycling factor [Candidatus Aminicenantes bacterium]
MIKELLEEAKTKLKELGEDFKKDIGKFRTGRASVSILDGIMVEYYGVPTPINQMATLSVPDANLIVIQPWDRNVIADIEKSLHNSSIDINPISDGKVIKLPVPPLDEQRRLEIIKTLKKYTEERKTTARNVRREYREMIKLMKDEKEISEDEERRAYDDLQKIIDNGIQTLEDIERTKEKHIMED